VIAVNRPHAGEIQRVAFTRGDKCKELAELLGGDDAFRLSGDLQRTCIAERVDLLVMRRLSGFDLVETVVPYRLRLDGVRGVAAAVAGGPHSPLAARMAAHLGAALRVPVELVTVADPEAPPDEAPGSEIDTPRGAERRVVPGRSPRDLVGALAPGTILVMGASEESWLHRQLLGPYRHLLTGAPSGAVIVRTAPRRCFQEAEDAFGAAISPHLRVADAISLVRHPATPVVDAGRLIGIAHWNRLTWADPESTVGEAMDAPISLAETDAVELAASLAAALAGSPVPVIDEDGRLTGMLDGAWTGGFRNSPR
jgi:hypothetical protein